MDGCFDAVLLSLNTPSFYLNSPKNLRLFLDSLFIMEENKKGSFHYEFGVAKGE